MNSSRALEPDRDAGRSFGLENLEARTLLSFSSVDLTNYSWGRFVGPMCLPPSDAAQAEVMERDGSAPMLPAISDGSHHGMRMDADGDGWYGDHGAAEAKAAEVSMMMSDGGMPESESAAPEMSEKPGEVYFAQQVAASGEMVQTIIVADAPPVQGMHVRYQAVKAEQESGSQHITEGAAAGRVESVPGASRIAPPPVNTAAPVLVVGKVARTEGATVVPVPALNLNVNNSASSVVRYSLLSEENSVSPPERAAARPAVFAEPVALASAAVFVPVMRSALIGQEIVVTEVEDVATQAAASIVPTGIATAMASAPEALSGALVVATPVQQMSARTTYNLAVLRLPAAWLSDSLAVFADESASVTRRTIKRMDVRKAVAISLGVVAFDAAVLSYAYKGRQKKKRQVRRAAYRSIFSDAGISDLAVCPS